MDLKSVFNFSLLRHSQNISVKKNLENNKTIRSNTRNLFGCYKSPKDFDDKALERKECLWRGAGEAGKGLLHGICYLGREFRTSIYLWKLLMMNLIGIYLYAKLLDNVET